MNIRINVILFVIGLLICDGTSAQSFQICEASGAALAQCAADWERVFHSGNKMEGESTVWNTASFQSFVGGVSLATIQNKWCPTGQFSLDAIYAISAKFLREHPEQWQARPVDLVLVPLAQTYPCVGDTKKKKIKVDIHG